MSRTAYQVTLWRRARTILRTTPGELRAVTEGEQRWLDLSDESAMTEEVAALVVRHCGREDYLERYALQVADAVTGEHIATFSPTLADLDAVRAGDRSMPASGLRLQDISDEVLIREIARRLRERLR